MSVQSGLSNTVAQANGGRGESALGLSSVLLAALLANCLAGNDYASAAGGAAVESDQYSLELPYGWAAATRSALEKVRRVTAQSRPAGPKVVVDAFFQPAEADGPDYPYAVVNISKYSDIWGDRQPTLQELETLFASLTKSASTAAAAAEPARRDLSIGKKVVTTDLDGRRYFTTQTVHMDGVGDVVSMSVDCFGRKALIQLQVHALAADWQKLEPTAEEMVRSFRLSPAAAYDEAPAGKPVAGRNDSLGLGLVCLGVVVLLVIARRQREKAKSQSVDPPSR